MQRGQEKDEREKQRAKDEVNRLNGVVSGSATPANDAKYGGLSSRKFTLPPPSGSRQVAPAERKQQLAQLADLGVAIPEEFRSEMAMAGDWQVVSETPIYERLKKEEEANEQKPTGLDFELRKRKYEEQDGEEDAGETTTKSGWGSTTRTYPETNEQGEGDLDLLLGSTRPQSQSNSRLKTSTPETELARRTQPAKLKSEGEANVLSASNQPFIKKESLEDTKSAIITITTATTIPNHLEVSGSIVKEEPNPEELSGMFKKRKTKQIRHK